MDPEYIILSEISQAEKHKCCMISFVGGIYLKTNSWIQRTEWWLPEIGTEGW